MASKNEHSLYSAPTTTINDAVARIAERCNRLATFSEEEGRLTRTFCSPPMRLVHQEMTEWMAATGMTVRRDAVGNLTGRHSSRATPALERLVIGSHLDTVPNAGRFDGVLGVLLGLAMVEVLASAQTDLPFDVELACFADEEGARFGTPFLGSRAMIGQFDPRLLELKDESGCTMAEVIRQWGGDPDTIGQEEMPARGCLGYLEAHIEQGPVLEELNCPLAVVDSIVGQTRVEAQFQGTAGHAGTVPMDQRCDALAAAAAWIAAVERRAQTARGLVATVGRMGVEPNAVNVIPGQVTLSVDVRHANDSARRTAVENLLATAADIAGRRGLSFRVISENEVPAIQCDPSLTRLAKQSMVDCGVPLQHMASGAGHDAAIMSRAVPVTMLFVRCAGGISHHPNESVDPRDIGTALRVMLRFGILLAKQRRAGAVPPIDEGVKD